MDRKLMKPVNSVLKLKRITHLNLQVLLRLKQPQVYLLVQVHKKELKAEPVKIVNLINMERVIVASQKHVLVTETIVRS